MYGRDASFQRFVEASPHVHCAKERCHSTTMLRVSTIDSSPKVQTRRLPHECCMGKWGGLLGTPGALHVCLQCSWDEGAVPGYQKTARA